MSVTVDRDLSAIPAELESFKPKLIGERQIVFQYPPSRIDSGEILNAIGAANLKIIDVSTRETELEDIFLRLTREAAAE